MRPEERTESLHSSQLYARTTELSLGGRDTKTGTHARVRICVNAYALRPRSHAVSNTPGRPFSKKQAPISPPTAKRSCSSFTTQLRPFIQAEMAQRECQPFGVLIDRNILVGGPTMTDIFPDTQQDWRVPT